MTATNESRRASSLRVATPAARAPAPVANYRLGAAYALLAAALIALQEPFSALAARKLDASDFIACTQISLLASIPLLLTRAATRRDFVALLADLRAWPKFAALFAIGFAGLKLYDIGLSSAHPVITAAVLNLSPFWAAVVALAISRKPLPGSARLFLGCFGVAFVGAMAIAWSQIDVASTKLMSDVLHSILHSRWIYALPMPVMFALSGTLVYVWFSDYDQSAAVGVNFLVSAVLLIPPAILHARAHPAPIDSQAAVAVLLLLIGTLAASAAGRLFYQAALTSTHNDNGFATMFFLVIPGLSALVSWPLSFWISDVGFLPNRLFFAGLALVTAPLLVFAISFRDAGAPAPLRVKPKSSGAAGP